MSSLPLSVLDLAPVSHGSDIATALQQSLDQVRLADSLGFHRYWYAEHHNMSTIASSATSLLIGRAAEHTERIRLGSGGVMLPNHSPLMVAEYYGTLAEMYGHRIDLGLGRAPGTDPKTAAALRRGSAGADSFVQDVLDLKRYLGPAEENAEGGVRAIPGQGTQVPLWMLGSSLDGATIAAHLGLPYSFASHFAPAARHQAMRVYRERFNPDSPIAQLTEPYAVGAVNVLVAPTDEEAEFMFTSAQQMVAGMATGTRGPIQPPVENYTATLPPAVLDFVESFQAVRAVGSPETVRERLQEHAEDMGVDELIVTTTAYDPAMRLRSFELLAKAWF